MELVRKQLIRQESGSNFIIVCMNPITEVGNVPLLSRFPILLT
jgi:hypothetical protein